MKKKIMLSVLVLAVLAVGVSVATFEAKESHDDQVSHENFPKKKEIKQESKMKKKVVAKKAEPAPSKVETPKPIEEVKMVESEVVAEPVTIVAQVSEPISEPTVEQQTNKEVIEATEAPVAPSVTSTAPVVPTEAVMVESPPTVTEPQVEISALEATKIALTNANVPGAFAFPSVLTGDFYVVEVRVDNQDSTIANMVNVYTINKFTGEFTTAF